ncbi:HEAT repeat domain-containing protein [Methanosarcina horonobensis]|uniref:HEAT repeat domain-containing protein n=1 Tax=Methanosarcina horonobensis TaxID=418008 RepID=UPI0022B8884C|nr:HEAT repeat domain-containing protein [Methanosarcina horonobensis]
MGVLGDNDPKVRARAAEALGRIGDKRAIGPLTETLNDEDERVRLFAKMGLEKN